MKKLITFLFVIVCMLVMLPRVSHGGIFTDPDAFEIDCTDESGLSPLYNATVTCERFLLSDGTSDYFLLKLQGDKVHILEGRKSHLTIFARTCNECGWHNIGTLEGGSELLDAHVVSIIVYPQDKFATIGFKLPRYMVGGETTIIMKFNYCNDTEPFTGNEIKICDLFVDKRSNCPIPEIPPAFAPNPFLSAEAKIRLGLTGIADTGPATLMDIMITGSMINLLANEALDYITVSRTYDGITSPVSDAHVELIDEGNTLRIRGLNQLKNEFTGTSYKIVYTKPLHPPFEYNIDKMCTLTVDANGGGYLPLFCVVVAPQQFIRIPFRIELPETPSDE